MLKNECEKLLPVLTLIGAVLLSGCEKAGFECPIPKEYSAEMQARGAEELNQLPKNYVISDFVADYGVLRAQSRACLGKIAK